MYEWHRKAQEVAAQIDQHIADDNDEQLTLAAIAKSLGYSEFHTSRKFREFSGMQFRDYLRQRRLAFALLEVRDSDRSLLDIATSYGFGSHAAFTRAFKSIFGTTPTKYRKNPGPVVLRTRIAPFDRYILEERGENMMISNDAIRAYYVSIPAHRFLHIKSYDSKGYFDFWEKLSQIPGQDCDTICGLLDSITGKLDGDDTKIGVHSGQIMAHLFEADGEIAEAYGVRLAPDWNGQTPDQMLLLDVPEAEYLVFEHGSFDFEHDCEAVGAALTKAAESYDFTSSEYELDESPGRAAYFYFDPEQFEKRIRPVKRK